MGLSDSKTEIDDIEGRLHSCKYFFLNLVDLWTSSDHNLKQRLQALIFADKIYYENKAIRTTATAFSLIWYPQGDLNPCLMAENHVSWAWLDDGGVSYFSFTEIHRIEI